MIIKQTSLLSSFSHVIILIMTMTLSHNVLAVGFNYSVYQGDFNSLPNFSNLAPVSQGESDQISVSVTNLHDNFAIVFEHVLSVNTEATYNFSLSSDDGSKLFINDTLVIGNDGLHAVQTEFGSVDLTVGTHFLRLEYFEKGGEASVELTYNSGNSGFQAIPTNGVLEFIGPLSSASGGSWSNIIAWPHVAASVANLPDGRIVTWNSVEINATPGRRDPTFSAIFDPKSFNFEDSKNNNPHNMFCSGIALTEDGSVMVNGGSGDNKDVSKFNLATAQWETLSPMNFARYYATAVTMPNNDVFMSFGRSAGVTSEIFSSTNQAWSLTSNVSLEILSTEQNLINSALVGGAASLQWYAQLSVTPNGKVLQAGPAQSWNLFDPSGGSANTSLGSLAGERARGFGNLVNYDYGKVMLIGGVDPSESNPISVNNVYLVDMNGATPQVTQGPAMNFARSFSNSVVLPTGEVLVVGGNTDGKNFSDFGTIFDTEIYSPETNSWRIAAPISVPRNYHSTAILLKDGKVLSAGGGSCGGCGVNHRDGQVYSPAYLFNEDNSLRTRPVINDGPEQVSAGDAIVVTASATTEKFNLVRLSGTTHHINADQRFLPLTIVGSNSGNYTIDLPVNPNVLLPGYYWLFAIDATGTPSVGRTIQVLRDPERIDSDGDGIIDNDDAFPNDANETIDSDGDGVGDNADAFPNDPNETTDTDGDGIGDNADDVCNGSRYVRFTALNEVNGNPWASAAEINLLDGNGQVINRSAWIVNASSEETVGENGNAINAIDGNTNTFWHTEWFSQTGESNDPTHPHHLVIDTSCGPAISGFTYLPRQGGARNGTVKAYEFYISDDGINWGQPIHSGEFTQDTALSTVSLPDIVSTIDSDGDGVVDSEDAFPNDANETIDSDSDGVGDNGDAFPNDPNEAKDTDGDGIGDNADPFPNDPDRNGEITVLPEFPRQSATLIVESHNNADRIWNVNPDNDSVSVSSNEGDLLVSIQVGKKPWSLAKSTASDHVYVTNKESATISIINTNTFEIEETINLSANSQPHGIVFDGSGTSYYVVLEATATLEKHNINTNAVIASVELGGTPRHLSMTYDDSKILVSNFVTPPVPGENTDLITIEAGSAQVFVLDPVSLALSNTILIPHDDRSIGEFEGPGLPNYLAAAAISFDSKQAYIPGKKDNIDSGELRLKPGMNFDQSVRAQTSIISLDNETANLGLDHDNTSVATSAAFSGNNRYLFVTLETSRELLMYDTQLGFELTRLNTGRAPQTVALSSNGAIAYVHNFMDRSISRFDLSQALITELPEVKVLSSINVVTNEALDSAVLLGKQHFYDAADDRLAQDNYMSCASCHKEGKHDGRVWDFTQFGEGLRNTTSLLGKAGTGQGLLHWTGNFDEVQDFEAQIRNFAGGTGLMSNADFNSGTRSEPLGDTKTGISNDLDALAAYLASLQQSEASPFRDANGDLSAAAEQGKKLFTQHECASCHAGLTATDSATGVRHDIGTVGQASGNRLDGLLDGFDTPSLLGVWATAPYLHDGSAATLADAVQAHDDVVLNTTELNQLVAYLTQIDDNADISIPSSPSGLVSDTFDGALDNTLWTFDDPIGDSTLLMTGTQASISVPAGTRHDLWKNTLDVPPRIRQAANDTDFEVEVKFDSTLTSKYQINGLTVEQDPTNLLRFDFYSNGSVTNIFSASFVNGNPSVHINSIIAEGAPLYLRVKRVGDQWTTSYSYDSNSWIVAGVYTHNLSVTSVGLFAGNAGVTSPSHNALFDYFIVDGFPPITSDQ